MRHQYASQRGESQKQTFDVLNGLRGVAAIAVANAHLSHYFAGFSPAMIFPAVDFFFVLSGFVIAYAYDGELGRGLSTRRFMLARVIRLYPLYLLGLLLGSVAMWIYERPPEHANFAVTFGFNLFMLPWPGIFDLSKNALYPLNFPVWSLFFELIANLIYALVASRLTNKVLALLIAAGFGGLITTGLLVGSLDQGVLKFQYLGGLARVTFSFFAGVALYRLWLARPHQRSLHPALLFFLLVLPLGFKLEGDFGWLYEVAIIALYMPLIVWLGAGARVKGIWLAICAVLGALSYPIYVIHAPVWTAVRAYNGWQGNSILHDAAPWSGLILIAFLCLVSWWLDKAIDRPLRRRISKTLLGRPERTTDGQSGL